MLYADSRRKRILIVEDEKDIGQLISMHLEDMGYETEHVTDGLEGAGVLEKDSYDLAILDIMLPGQNGFSVCEQVRSNGVKTPLLFLTARGDQEDKLHGLEIGADDYLSKPFCIHELAARVNAILRRQKWSEESSAKPRVQFGDLTIDLLKQQVERAGQSISLTSIEFRLLNFLAQNSERAVSREELLKEVWGYQTSAYDHTVNTHINRLRSKIEKDPASPEVVLTIWGTGYQFGQPSTEH